MIVKEGDRVCNYNVKLNEATIMRLERDIFGFFAQELLKDKLHEQKGSCKVNVTVYLGDKELLSLGGAKYE